MGATRVNTPIYQRAITWVLYLVTGAVALGVLLGAINDAKAIITPAVTYTATAAAVVLWALVEVIIWKRPIRWNTGKLSTRITGPGKKNRLAVAGAVLLLWAPRVIPSPVSAETLKRLNAELLDAAANGAETGIQQALGEGADIDGRNQFGQTALMTASWGGQPNPNVPKFPRPGAVKLLVERGAGVNLKDDYGNTALVYAAVALFTFDNSVGGQPALAELLVAPSREDMRQRVAAGIGAIETLCDRGADVNAVNNTGSTALMLVAGTRMNLDLGPWVPDRDNLGAWVPDRDVVVTLIRCGAKTDVKDKDGKTALRLAEEVGNLEIANVLREAGAKE